jgi:NADH:ubiquinone oxidoreductase subunit 5 (subunit L)/multisubunit Na+/H+ antiporter MnhA subunit
MKLTHALSGLPFIGVLAGIFFANRAEPFVLGLPFALFWVTLWVVLTALIMAIVYRLDR